MEKPLEKPLIPMVDMWKTIDIPSFQKMYHRRGLTWGDTGLLGGPQEQESMKVGDVSGGRGEAARASHYLITALNSF